MGIPEKDSFTQSALSGVSAGGDITVGNISQEVFATIHNIETCIVEISAAKVTQQELKLDSPYQGLKRFNLKDREYFFGRDKLIAELCEAVNQSSLSLILGASGSGKSSVVRAGVIPELKRSLKAQAFYDFIFTPDQDPFDSLYRCLRSEEKDKKFSKQEAETALESEPDTLSKVIRNLRKGEERWLIFIDQFEELFTICDDDKREKFISGLVQFVRSKDNFVKIVLAMRSDFLEQFSFYPDFAAIAQKNIHLVSELYPDQLRQAIEQPAAKHGVVFEEGLVEQIIDEVKGQKGSLPLLQYTLDLLWKIECQTIGADGRLEIADRTLNKRTYNALEGVRGALQSRVNEIYSRLNQEEKITTKQIFLKLVRYVNTGLGDRPVSERAYQSEFSRESAKKILHELIDNNLLISSSEYSKSEKNKVISNKATVEIAHEILLFSWDELKQWLEQEKEAHILKHWLMAEVRKWSKAREEGNELKAKQELLRGSRLYQIVQFRLLNAFENVGGLEEEEIKFIDASLEEAERLNDAELTKKHLERKDALDKTNWLLIPSAVVNPISESAESISKSIEAISSKIYEWLIQNFEPQINDSVLHAIKNLDRLPDLQEVMNNFFDGVMNNFFSEGFSKLAKSHVDSFYDSQTLNNRNISQKNSIDVIKYSSAIDGILGALTGFFSLESALITTPIDIIKSWSIQVYIICFVAHVYGVSPTKEDALTILFSSEQEVLKLFKEKAIAKRFRSAASQDALKEIMRRIVKEAAEEIVKAVIGKAVDKSIRKFLEKIVPFVFGATLSATTCWWDTTQTGKRAILYYELQRDLEFSSTDVNI
ncbi:ATP-binding protein [Thermoleptolyngbya oregonensis NK1-22]|uniref:ATP-binding protein n=1 Tax=Thermoleptolyngbya oregonensis NK1-22 TaxID=2547457 RepID=A0AA97B9C1_9CYAN|nr:ATP-binding protein [Thermoleptolyngbya oregonensis]WOB42295.1 ATP-binding protein [Thermoleptolyngbya oregonensis NK1-22]